jgi:hypothetical protein
LCHKWCIYTYKHILIPRRCGTSQGTQLETYFMIKEEFKHLEATRWAVQEFK